MNINSKLHTVAIVVGLTCVSLIVVANLNLDKYATVSNVHENITDISIKTQEVRIYEKDFLLYGQLRNVTGFRESLILLLDSIDELDKILAAFKEELDTGNTIKILNSYSANFLEVASIQGRIGFSVELGLNGLMAQLALEVEKLGNEIISHHIKAMEESRKAYQASQFMKHSSDFERTYNLLLNEKNNIEVEMGESAADAALVLISTYRSTFTEIVELTNRLAEKSEDGILHALSEGSESLIRSVDSLQARVHAIMAKRSNINVIVMNLFLGSMSIFIIALIYRTKNSITHAIERFSRHLKVAQSHPNTKNKLPPFWEKELDDISKFLNVVAGIESKYAEKASSIQEQVINLMGDTKVLALGSQTRNKEQLILEEQTATCLSEVVEDMGSMLESYAALKEKSTSETWPCVEVAKLINSLQEVHTQIDNLVKLTNSSYNISKEIEEATSKTLELSSTMHSLLLENRKAVRDTKLEKKKELQGIAV